MKRFIYTHVLYSVQTCCLPPYYPPLDPLPLQHLFCQPSPLEAFCIDPRILKSILCSGRGGGGGGGVWVEKIRGLTV